MDINRIHGRKSGGTGGRVPPPHVFRWGTQYQMSPPPPRFGGRMNFGRYNVFFIFLIVFFFFFFFFLLVRNVRDVGWVPLHILTCATFDADGAPGKKCRSPPPPPPPKKKKKKKCVCPSTIRFGFAPLIV